MTKLKDAPGKKARSLAKWTARLAGNVENLEGRKAEILQARGAFRYLPIRYSNDIVHGSWYVRVWGV